ncbi:MAG: rhomboid family intramembrane serine protease [Arcanobacterium sp.]|nr:rhomboid family intramembrane serine protease [Arcanobacterium sp.]
MKTKLFGRSTITGAIIAINVVVYVITRILPDVLNAAMFFVPYALSEPWRFLTSAFLHGGLIHLAFNMITLYFVGVGLERALGAWRYIFAYLCSAVAGNVAMVVTSALTGDPWIAAVGASGAVFGLFGVWLAINWRDWRNTQSMLIFLGINLVWGVFAANVAWQAHIGGLLAGIVLGFAWMRSARTARTRRREFIRDVVSSGAVVIALGAIAYGAMLFVPVRI